MEASLLNEVRRERTEYELTHLTQSVKQWINDQRTADVDEGGQYIGRHKTQLEAIESVLVGALEVLSKEISPETLPATEEVGLFFDQCRDADMAALWLQRVWEYFKEKFDQRLDARWGPLLKAADEVVWSCYRQVFVHPKVKQANIVQGPTPLPFVEAWYSPAARHSNKPLVGDLELNVPGLTDELAAFLGGLPIPLVRLPPWCADAPWWLVYVGHEVGHLVQHELDLVGHFRQGLEEAARTNGLPDTDVQRWGQWGAEIFADVFSVMALGPWALWAIVEVEWTALNRMRQRKATYPAPLVRLALMAHLAQQVHLPTQKALRGLDPVALAGDHPHMKRDMAVVKDAVAFALGPLPHGLGTLPDVCDFDATIFQRDKSVDFWARELQSNRSLNPSRQLKTARFIMSGALQAWSEVSTVPRDDRQAVACNLAERTRTALIKSAPPGTRANLQPSGAQPGGGQKLADLLRQAGHQQWISDEDES